MFTLSRVTIGSDDRVRGRLHVLCATTLAAACLSGMVSAEDSFDTAAVAATKAATVFIKVECQQLRATGSAFVVSVDEDKVILVSNHHVVDPKSFNEATERGRPGHRNGGNAESMEDRLKAVSITAVFDSGTKKERSAKAEILALDPEYDLALLRVEGVNPQPPRIPFEMPSQLAETMAVYSFGFPFGQALSTANEHPAITVGKAAISSLRDDEEGELAIVQIDGNLNPGNSGGPIVNARGELVGVAVATIRNSNGIALAIPVNRLQKAFAGRLSDPRLVSGGSTNKTSLSVELAVVDIANSIRSMSVRYVATSQRDTQQVRNIASLENVRDHEELDLKRGKLSAVASLPDSARGAKALLLQGVFTLTDGTTQTTKVFLLPVPSASSERQQKTASHNAPQTSPFVDGQTKILGGAFDPVFTDQAPAGAKLVGFELGLGAFVNNKVIKAVRPIYRDGSGEETHGQQYGTKLDDIVTLKANEGYVVGSILLKAGLGLDGLSVKFVRQKGDALDPTDSYESEWVGGKGGHAETKLGDDTNFVVGIVGKTNAKDCTGLGLLRATK